MTRRGLLVAGAAALAGAWWEPSALAAGARSGPWCKAAVHAGNFEFKLYELTDDDSKAASVHAYVKRHAIDFPIALDSTGSVFKALGGQEYPSHMFLDSAGNVTCVAIGMLERAQMDNEIAVAIAASAHQAK